MMCFNYDDYPEFSNSKFVKCRKPHRCDGCARIIEPGETAHYEAGKFDGAFYTQYVCTMCLRVMATIALREIERGCHWRQAWCASADLAQYVMDLDEPLVLLRGSLEDCRQQVTAAWEQRKAVVV